MTSTNSSETSELDGADRNDFVDLCVLQAKETPVFAVPGLIRWRRYQRPPAYMEKPVHVPRGEAVAEISTWVV